MYRGSGGLTFYNVASQSVAAKLRERVAFVLLGNAGLREDLITCERVSSD